MATRKKKFDCNHKGYGKFCHRCHNEKNNPKAITKSSTVAVETAAAAEVARENKKKAERTTCPKCKGFKLTRLNFNELIDMTKKEFICRDCKHEFDAPGE